MEKEMAASTSTLAPVRNDQYFWRTLF